MLFSEGTLVFYFLLMATKPQMLCALDKSPFELEWQTLREGTKIISQERKRRSSSVWIDSLENPDLFPAERLHQALRSRSLAARLRTERYFATITRRTAIGKSKTKSFLKLRLLVLLISRRLLSHLFALIIRTRAWLSIFAFLICVFDSHQMSPIDGNITFINPFTAM